MTLSLHKLWAGSGYEYLTQQVARQDSTSRARSSLASYYTERGETPGVWVGTGLAGLEGLEAGDLVTAEQMRALFGAGHHPLAGDRVRAAREAGAVGKAAADAGRLGTPFRLRSSAGRAFDLEVTRRLAARVGGTADPSTTSPARPALVSEVAAEWFQRDHGRAPVDARELAGAVARWTRQVPQPVAGYDLTFSPVKSVSALWAVSPPAVAAEIERAHQAAAADALRFVEERALFTREGTNGVRQVEVMGLVATGFTHRDSRAGDPDLHTHVAVANKVQTRQGRWLAIDGRVLYGATVAASETYNTALEGYLGERLGLRFAARPTPAGRREVRELVGVDERLLVAWSSRRQAIDVRRGELGEAFQRRTGRPPTREEAWALAQQATLETRDRKHEPSTLDEQRATWARQAADVLGDAHQVAAMVSRTLAPHPAAVAERVDAAWVARTAATVTAVMESERAVWGPFHLQAETQRQIRVAGHDPGLARHLVDLVVAEAANQAVPLAGPVAVPEPPVLRRSDGVSVYQAVGTERWTSSRVIDAEKLLLDLAARRDGQRVDGASVQVALQEAAVEEVALNAGQVALVRDLAESGARVQVALAPAGTGKTTALRVLAQAWTRAGGSVVGLAPSASAAAVLAEQIGGAADTLAKLVWSLDHPGPGTPGWVTGLGPGSLVVIDEAGLADTPSLARAVQHVVAAGGSVRLVGDDRQLGSVGAGGILRDLDQRYGAVRLEEVVRFDDPAEAAASLALREGRKEALGFYLDQRRVHVGDATTAPSQVLEAWAVDRVAGRDSLMLASTRDAVADLNRAARTHRIEGQPVAEEAVLADGNRASAGDIVITRTNNRRLAVSGAGWVRNGARWTVISVEGDGALTVVPLGGEARLRLPAEYVGASVQLGYASTIHGAQGVTADTVHGLLTGAETRPQLYTLLTRGRHANHLYLLVDGAENTHDLDRPDSGDAFTPTEALQRILERDGAARSAHSQLADLRDPALRLPREIDAYVDALHLAIERTTDEAVVHRLDRLAGQLTPDLTEAPAWPTLRAYLLLRAADGIDPEQRLRQVLAERPLDDARDPAAVLHYRANFLDQAETGDLLARKGPLPWLPHVPDRLQIHPTWGPYLAARAALIADLAQHVGEAAAGNRPAWAQLLGPEVTEEVLGQLAVWRAAQRVSATDPNPIGPRAADPTSRDWQRHLDGMTRVPAATAAPLVVGTVLEGSDHDPFREALLRHVRRLAQAGVDVDRLLRTAAISSPLPDDHPSAALWWRLHRQLPAAVLSPPQVPAPTPRPQSRPTVSTRENRTDNALLLAGLLRISRQPDPALVLESPGDARKELVRVNRLAHDFYRSQLHGSWSADHLTERCGSDLSTDLRFQPGHAPAGWTALVDHLRRLGVTEKDMLAAGLVTRTRQGRTVDRFRDRLVLPIWDQHGNLIGFVARRHPDRDERVGPKYLNTPTTALFAKGHHLYGEDLLPSAGQPGRARDAAPTPVLVEGPLDAIAVSLAGNGRYLGLATLGTALTPSQASILAAQQVEPVQAFDSDPAGRSAASRNFWQLTVDGADPRLATMPPGLDPAAVLTTSGPAGLRQHLDQATSQGDSLLLATRPHQQDPPVDILLAIAAVRPPHTWAASIDAISRTTGLTVQDLRERLLPLVQAATRDPEAAARAGGTSTAPLRVERPQERPQAAVAEPTPHTYPGNVERSSQAAAQR